jgi:hypothetical protein
VDTATLGVIVMLPGVLAAVSPNKRLKYVGFAISFLMALGATLGLFR